MNLNEQIYRIKGMMGLQPINEGIFKGKGKFKEIIKNLLGKKTNPNNNVVDITNDKVLNKVNPYKKKYGDPDDSVFYVANIHEQLTSDIEKKGSDNYYEANLSISIITRDPLPLPNESDKKSTEFFCSVQFLKKENIHEKFYTYYKGIYYIDGKETDKWSLITDGENETCMSGTLENGSGDCGFPKKLIEKIQNTFKDTPNINEINDWLNKIK